MPRGRPKGSTNRIHTFPQRLQPPDNWTTDVAQWLSEPDPFEAKANPYSIPSIDSKFQGVLDNYIRYRFTQQKERRGPVQTEMRAILHNLLKRSVCSLITCAIVIIVVIYQHSSYSLFINWNRFR